MSMSEKNRRKRRERSEENKWLEIHKVQHVLKSSCTHTTYEYTWYRVRSSKLDRKHYVILLNKWTNFRPCGCLLLWLLWGTCCITVGKMFSIIKIPYHGAQMSHSGKHVVEKLVKNFLLRVNR